jgi:hypothetical protein
MTLRHTTIVGGLALVAFTACGKGKSPKKEPPPVPKDARDAAGDCPGLFDRYRASLAAHLAQLGITETADAARTRDAAGLAACAALPEAKRACLSSAPVAPASWATCGVEPVFTLFDTGIAHEHALGAVVPAADSPGRVAALAGTWNQPARGLDDAVTWTIDKTGALAVRRTSKRGKVDEPKKQLAFARDRLLAITTGNSTQFAPFFRDGNTLYLSWTSGAMPIAIADEKKLALDLASDGRWLVWNAPECTIVDPRRGATTATCAWSDDAGARTFSIEGAGLAQRWTLHGDTLVQPAMETYTKR